MGTKHGMLHTLIEKYAPIAFIFSFFGMLLAFIIDSYALMKLSFILLAFDVVLTVLNGERRKRYERKRSKTSSTNNH